VDEEPLNSLHPSGYGVKVKVRNLESRSELEVCHFRHNAVPDSGKRWISFTVYRLVSTASKLHVPETYAIHVSRVCENGQ